MEELPKKLWHRPYPSAAAVVRARELRQELTPSEKTLWDILRGSKFHGAKFRRQHPIGKYILDFYCAQSRLAIELDGSVHHGREAEDDWREKIVGTHGIRFLRFTNDDVENRLDEVLRKIELELMRPA
ncbi:MAG TPA: endonuclease domain-containing protein, partial [Candidatus Kapabacteria bacterium]|nr:endonuclease domain-containing protein [Candidatus Kapabacteria bacterium]